MHHGISFWLLHYKLYVYIQKDAFKFCNKFGKNITWHWIESSTWQAVFGSYYINQVKQRSDAISNIQLWHLYNEIWCLKNILHIDIYIYIFKTYEKADIFFIYTQIKHLYLVVVHLSWLNKYSTIMH